MLHVREPVMFYLFASPENGSLSRQRVELPPGYYDGETGEGPGMHAGKEWALFLIETGESEERKIIKIGRPLSYLQSINHERKDGKRRLMAKLHMRLFGREKDFQLTLALGPTLVKKLVYEDATLAWEGTIRPHEFEVVPWCYTEEQASLALFAEELAPPS
jgi:hypothetical protein